MFPVTTTALLIESCYSGFYRFHSVTFVSKGRVPMRSTGSVEQPIELLSGLTYLSKYPFNLSLVATLELTLHHPLPLRWRRHSIVSNQRKGERPPLQRSHK